MNSAKRVRLKYDKYVRLDKKRRIDLLMKLFYNYISSCSQIDDDLLKSQCLASIMDEILMNLKFEDPHYEPYQVVRNLISYIEQREYDRDIYHISAKEFIEELRKNVLSKVNV